MNPQWFTGYGAVIFIMTFGCTSNHLIFMTNSIRGIDYQTIEAAQNLGASPIRIFFSVVFPVLKPTVFAITVLTFLTGLSAMSAPLVVGGRGFQTINPLIIDFSKDMYSRDIASLMAVILGFATIILLTILSRLEKKGNYISISKVKSRLVKLKINNHVLNVFLHIVAYSLFLIYTVPLLLIIVYSFSNYQAILGGRLDFSLLTTFGEPHLILFNKVLVGTIYLLLIAYVITKLPFSLRMIRASFFSVDKSLEEAAQSLGAGTLKTMFKVVLPIVFPAIISVAALNFNGTLAEYDMTAFLYHPLVKPLGIVIRSASDATASEDAITMTFVYAVVLMIMSSITLYFVYGKKPSIKGSFKKTV
jgi:iron(III) transport system permease protein